MVILPDNEDLRCITSFVLPMRGERFLKVDYISGAHPLFLTVDRYRKFAAYDIDQFLVLMIKKMPVHGSTLWQHHHPCCNLAPRKYLIHLCSVLAHRRTGGDPLLPQKPWRTGLSSVKFEELAGIDGQGPAQLEISTERGAHLVVLELRQKTRRQTDLVGKLLLAYAESDPLLLQLAADIRGRLFLERRYHHSVAADVVLMRSEQFPVLSALQLQGLQEEAVLPLHEVEHNLRDMPQVRLEARAVGLLFQEPVRYRTQIVQPRAHVGEEPVGDILVAPEVLHAREAVKHVARSRRQIVLDGVERCREPVDVTGRLDPHHAGIRLFIEFKERIVVLPLARGETVYERKVLGRHDRIEIVQHGLRRPIEAHIDHLLVVDVWSGDEVPDEDAVCGPSLYFPDDIV